MTTLSLDYIQGDVLTAREYSAWQKQSMHATYAQIRRGNILIQPWSQVPLRWRKADCQAALSKTHAVQQKSERLRKKFRKAHAA